MALIQIYMFTSRIIEMTDIPTPRDLEILSYGDVIIDELWITFSLDPDFPYTRGGVTRIDLRPYGSTLVTNILFFPCMPFIFAMAMAKTDPFLPLDQPNKSARRFSPEEPPGDPSSSHVPSWFFLEVPPGRTIRRPWIFSCSFLVLLGGSTRRIILEEPHGDPGSFHVPSWFFSKVRLEGLVRKNHPKTPVLPMFLLGSSRRFSREDQPRRTTRRPWFFPCPFLVLLGGSARKNHPETLILPMFLLGSARRFSPEEPPRDPDSSHVPSWFY
ncbi:hypothetical protein Dimus_007804 [Dionaea muscipula]